MHKKSILLIILTAIILTGCSTTPTQQTKTDIPTTNSEKKTFTGSFAEMVKQGVGMKCAYKIEGIEFEGYIKGKNYRGQMKTQGKIGEIIMKDNCMWTWDNQTKTGIKICNQDTSTWEVPNNKEIEQGEIKTPEGIYNCHLSPISSNKFTPPSNIKFTDIDAMMQETNIPDNIPNNMPNIY